MERLAKPPLGFLKGVDHPTRKWLESLTKLMNRSAKTSSNADSSSRTVAVGTWVTLHSVTISGVQTSDLLTVGFRSNLSGGTLGDKLWAELLVDGSTIGPQIYFVEPVGSTSADTGNIIFPRVGITGLEGDITVLVRWTRAVGSGTFYCDESRFDWELKRV